MPRPDKAQFESHSFGFPQPGAKGRGARCSLAGVRQLQSESTHSLRRRRCPAATHLPADIGHTAPLGQSHQGCRVPVSSRCCFLLL